MLQTLLAERLRMRVHSESEDADGSEARRARPNREAGVGTTLDGRGIVAIVGRRASISQLTQSLERACRRS
jgi:hypothetical protein